MLPFIERLLRPLRRPRVKLSKQAQFEHVSLGTEYGGYAVIPTRLDESSVVYSFGVGTDISFDEGLIALRGVTVHAFDPTPRSLEWVKAQTLPKQFVFHPWGVANYDGSAHFHAPKDPTHVSHTLVESGNVGTGTVEAPVLRLQTIMERLGHDHIDLLKMDIEGAEYDVLDDLLGSKLAVPQILAEFHHFRSGIPLEKTQRVVTALEQAGYVAFNASPSGYEFSFVRPDLLPGIS